MSHVHSQNPFLVQAPSFQGTPVFDFGDAAPARDPNAAEALGYALVKTGPALRADECELPDVSALEITISWGSNVLHVAHLNPPRAFHVGDASGGEEVDFVAPSDAAARWPLVALVGGVPHAIVPAGSDAEIELPGQEKRALDSTLAQPFAEHSGARAIALTTNATVTIRSGALVFRVGVVAAGKPTSRRILGGDRAPATYFGIALVAHAALAGALAFFTPALGLSSENDFDAERRYMVQQYLDAAAERERENKPQPSAPTNEPTGTGESGPEARGSQGKLGKTTVTTVNKRIAFKGTADHVELPREAALREAQTMGIIGLLNTMNGDPSALRVPWGRDAALGTDPMSAIGDLWSDSIGDVAGAGGLHHSGYEEGGGGRGEQIGLGGVSTCGSGVCLGLDNRFGVSSDRLRNPHKPAVPQMRPGTTTVSGRLPAEVIQRAVRQNFGRFRMCYEQGLMRNPNLEGRVTARFVIGRDGGVSNVSNGGSDLPDSGVVSCVVSAFYGLSFPAPEGGIVTVSYPIAFSPGR
jgi:hypothetical protein